MKQHESSTSVTPPFVYRPWLFRWTLALLGLLWPLVWVGSLVTTTDAGMSVPDWPNTYGDNLLLYPVSTWLSGPFDLFIEHGHRLLGMLVGVVAIAVVVVAFYSERRRWVQALAVAGLVLVIVQGVLGGMRVVLSDRVLAMVHGCTAPIVFAAFTVLAVATGRWWWTGRQKPVKLVRRRASKPAEAAGGGDESGSGDAAAVVSTDPRGATRGVTVTAFALILMAYVQLVLGAQLRHVSMAAPPQQFTHTVAAHVLLAFVIWAVCVVFWVRIRKCGEMTLSQPAMLLLGLVSIQILLGLSTWVVNYGFPMFQNFGYTARYLVHAKSFWGSFIVCGHVATGSLILAMAVLLATRCVRLRHLARTATARTAISGTSLAPMRPLER